MTYRIYYSDGSVFEGEPGDTPPARGVQVIVQEQEQIGWHTQAKCPWYVWREEQGRWVGIETHDGLWDFLLDTGLVLFGRTMIGQDFYDIMNKAVKDLGEEKTGWFDDEERLDG
jgi:hypothetical protein